MSRLAVLVTTMNEQDHSKYSEMNLQTDAVIANQADFEGFTETEKEGWYVFDKHGKMIPWVHFDDDSLICLYPDMFTPIEK